MTIGEGLYKYTSKYERPEDELMELSNLGIIGTIQANESWLDLIMTPKFSGWCCDVAKGIIDNFLSSLHEGRFKDKMIEQMSLQEDG